MGGVDIEIVDNFHAYSIELLSMMTPKSCQESPRGRTDAYMICLSTPKREKKQHAQIKEKHYNLFFCFPRFTPEWVSINPQNDNYDDDDNNDDDDNERRRTTTNDDERRRQRRRRQRTTTNERRTTNGNKTFIFVLVHILHINYWLYFPILQCTFSLYCRYHFHIVLCVL